MSNPLLRQVVNGRWTPDELLEAYKYIRDEDPRVKDFLHGFNQETAPKLIHIAETIDAAKQLRTEDGKVIGLSTGYTVIDQMMRGIRPGDIVVVFGDTMHGKSLFVQNVSLNIATQGEPILFIGTELVNDENTERFLDMSEGNEELVAGLPIIYPAEIPEYRQVDSIVEEAKKDGIKLVVIDHLHMFDHNSENEAVGLSSICKEIKRVAIKHEIAVILVSHINEDKYRSGAPHLKDLKGSSSIKQIASFALAVYSPDKDAHRKHDIDQNLVKVVLRKWRRGNPKQHIADLAILPNARLAEKLTISAFPSR